MPRFISSIGGLCLVGFLSSCDGTNSFEEETPNEASTSSIERLSLSSKIMSSDSRIFDLSSSMSSFNDALDEQKNKSIQVLELNKMGEMGYNEETIIFPWADVVKGGTSEVLDMEGKQIGSCFMEESTCEEGWNLLGAFVEVDWTPSHLSSELRVTDYIPSTKDRIGWAAAGWWIILNYDKNIIGTNPFEKAKPIGLTGGSWIRLEVNYPKGEILTIELKGEDIDESDENQSPPRLSYVGKGYFEVIDFPISSVKRAEWSNPASYDPKKVTAIGLLRLEVAQTEGAEFPSTKKEENLFEFSCISFDESRWGQECEFY